MLPCKVRLLGGWGARSGRGWGSHRSAVQLEQQPPPIAWVSVHPAFALRPPSQQQTGAWQLSPSPLANPRPLLTAGESLFYAAGGQLFGLDCSGILQLGSGSGDPGSSGGGPGSGSNSGGSGPRATHIPTPGEVLLLAAPGCGGGEPALGAADGQRAARCQLTLLTAGGQLLSALCPAGAALAAQAACPLEQPPGVRDLEHQMQVWLGGTLACLGCCRRPPCLCMGIVCGVR